MCGCTRRLPSVADCQAAAAATGLDADVAQLPDGYQTMVRTCAWRGGGRARQAMAGSSRMLKALGMRPLHCRRTLPRPPLPPPLSPQVGEASRIELAPQARLRLGISRLLLLDAPLLVLIDDADRFLTAVPRLPEVVARLRSAGASVILTANASSSDALRAALPPDVHTVALEGGRLRAAP